MMTRRLPLYTDFKDGHNPHCGLEWVVGLLKGH